MVTESYYTKGEDFTIADAVFDCIGEAGDERFSLNDLTTPGLLVRPRCALLACSPAVRCVGRFCSVWCGVGRIRPW